MRGISDGTTLPASDSVFLRMLTCASCAEDLWNTGHEKRLPWTEQAGSALVG